MAGDPFGSDDDIDAFVAECEAAERDAAAVVREALVELRGMPAPEGALGAAADQARAGLGRWPLDWPPRAAGFGARPPQDDVVLLLEIAATISPREPGGLAPEEEAAITSLELGDWAGAVIETVRTGPGAAPTPRRWSRRSTPARRSTGRRSNRPTSPPTGCRSSWSPPSGRQRACSTTVAA